MRQVRRSHSTPKRKGWGFKHQQIKAQLMAQGGGCAWSYLGGCGGPLEADHVVPVIHGGETSIENERLMCRRHNRRRGGKTRRVFL